MRLTILIALIFGANVAFGVGGSLSAEASGHSFTIDCGENAIKINSARYGGNCGSGGSDQSANLALYCDGFPSCTYSVSAGIIGDPAGGCGKTYVYDYTCTSTPVDPEVKYGKVAGEAQGKSLTIDCGNYEEITVTAAMYGRNCGNRYSPGYSDQTSKLGAACDGQTTCSYDINGIGDPAGGCPKEYDYQYTCTDPCVEAECNDGDPCNGEEYCEAGDCVDPGDLECARSFVCETGVGCVRDCSTFAIDGYLRDCSVEFGNQGDSISDLNGEIKRLDGLIATTDSGVQDNQEDIESNDEDITDLQTRTKDLEDAVKELTERIDAFAPLAGSEPPEAYGQNVGVYPLDFYSFWYKYQMEIIFVFLLANVILMVSLCWMCYCGEGKKQRYSRVSNYYESDREDVNLNRKE